MGDIGSTSFLIHERENILKRGEEKREKKSNAEVIPTSLIGETPCHLRKVPVKRQLRKISALR